MLGEGNCEDEDAVDAKDHKRPILCKWHIVVLVPILAHVKPRRQQWTLRRWRLHEGLQGLTSPD